LGSIKLRLGEPARRGGGGKKTNCSLAGLAPARTPASYRSRPRSTYGKRLAELRKAAGLTQVELANVLGVPQSNIAFWEQSEKPPRSDVLPAMAQAFGVRLEELLKVEVEKTTAAKKRNGPTGRVREVFDRVSKLPRRQQEKIVEFVSAFVTQRAKQTGLVASLSLRLLLMRLNA